MAENHVSLEQICYERSQAIVVASVDSPLFSKSKNKDLRRISKSTANVVLVMEFHWSSKFVFP